MLDVAALGELLIDFTPAVLSPAGNALFEGNPGGAPANVLVALARLGGRGAFLGKVGEDEFGRLRTRRLRRRKWIRRSSTGRGSFISAPFL